MKIATDLELLPTHVIEALRQRFNVEPDDSSKDEEIMKLSASELHREYCMWNGLIGWSQLLIDALDSIREVKNRR